MSHNTRRVTMADLAYARGRAAGHAYIGMITGLYSYAPQSNLTHALSRYGLTRDTAHIEIGARAGRNANDGHQILIFRRRQYVN